MAEVTSIGSRFDLGDKLRKARRITKGLAYDEKLLRYAVKQLFKIKVSKIERILRRHATKPEKARSKTVPILHRLAENLEIFIRQCTAVFTELDAVVIELEREEFEDLRKIETIVLRWTDKPLDQSYFTKGIISDLESSFKKFKDKVVKFVGQDVRDDKRLRRLQQPKVGWLTRLKRKMALLRQIRKLEKRATKKSKKESAIEAEINRQLEHGIELNFPYLFAKMLHEEGVVEAIIHRIRNDIKQLVIDHIKEHNRVVRHAVPIVRLFENYPEWAEHKGLTEAWSNFYLNIGFEAEKYANIDIKDQRAIYYELHRDNNIFDFIIKKLKEQDVTKTTFAGRQMKAA